MFFMCVFVFCSDLPLHKILPGTLLLYINIYFQHLVLFYLCFEELNVELPFVSCLTVECLVLLFSVRFCFIFARFFSRFCPNPEAFSCFERLMVDGRYMTLDCFVCFCFTFYNIFLSRFCKVMVGTPEHKYVLIRPPL